MARRIGVYLEVGSARVFASALDWPGWCRSGRDQDAALRALVAYGARYKRDLGRAASGFVAPAGASELRVVEHLEGNATTDFGAPGMVPRFDGQRLEKAGLERLIAILRASRSTFDRAAKAAEGVALRKGPRGGGRTVAAMVAHVVDAENGYLRQLGGASPSVAELQKAIPRTLRARLRGEIPAEGPRGGVRWTPRYFVRRAAWHALDHAWEIEDRAIPES